MAVQHHERSRRREEMPPNTGPGKAGGARAGQNRPSNKLTLNLGHAPPPRPNIECRAVPDIV